MGVGWGGGAQEQESRPCAHPAGCEKFSWVLFIVSIIPGNEGSAIRPQLAVSLGRVKQNKLLGLQEGRPVCQKGLKAPLGTSNVMQGRELFLQTIF